MAFGNLLSGELVDVVVLEIQQMNDGLWRPSCRCAGEPQEPASCLQTRHLTAVQLGHSASVSATVAN
jgi:hypothetical protein